MYNRLNLFLQIEKYSRRKCIKIKMERSILLISYGDYRYDGRLRELVNVGSLLGNLKVICRGSSTAILNGVLAGSEVSSYFDFIKTCIKTASTMKKIDCLIVDNRRAIFPAIVIKCVAQVSYTVQDMRELYLIKETRHLAGKIGCVLESFFLKQADFVICANEQRCRMVKKLFALTQPVYNFENYRLLKYQDTDCDLSKKYAKYFKKRDTFKCISTAGCSVSRGTLDILNAIRHLQFPIELYLVGDSNKEDVAEVKRLVQKYKIEDVHIIGNLIEGDLKYFIQNCDIGIVIYNQCDTNNKYCASGKVFEYILDGLPILTSTNPPLREFCKKYGVGIATNDYGVGIARLYENYIFYKENVRQSVDSFDIKENNQNLAKAILKKMESV